MTKIVEEIINNLKNLNTHTSLRFNEIENISETIIKVSYYGHEVGGSYVAETQVTPNYIEDIRYTCNRNTKFVRRSSGGMGSDIYHFDVKIKEIFDKKKYKPKGKFLRVANSSRHISDLSYEWVFCSLIYTGILKNKKLMNSVGVILKKNHINIDGKNVVNVVEYSTPQSYSNTITYNETYDILTDNIHDLFYKINKVLVNQMLEGFGYTERCENIYTAYQDRRSESLVLEFDNGFKHYSDFVLITNKLTGNTKQLLSSLESYVKPETTEKVETKEEVKEEVKEVIKETEPTVKIEKCNIELEKYIASDGKIFELNIETFSENLKEKSLKYEKDYQKFLDFKKTKPAHEKLEKFDQERMDERFYEEYDFYNFQIDSEKLKKYKAENWEHFKWSLFKNHLRVDNGNNYTRNRNLNIATEYNNINSGEDLLNFVESIFERRSNGRKYVFISTKIEKFHILHKSGLHKLYNNQNELINDILSDKHTKLDDLKYAIETLKLEISPSDINKSMDFSRYKHIGSWLDSNNKIKDGSGLKLMEDKTKNQKVEYHDFYYLADTKEIVDYLLDNFKGDYNKITPKVLQSSEKTYYLIRYCDEKNIDLELKKENLHKLIHFIEFWFNRSYTLNILKDGTFSYSSFWSVKSDTFQGEIISDKLLEKHFMKRRCGDYNSERIPTLLKIFSKTKIDFNKKAYFLMVIQNDNHTWTHEGNEKFSDIREIFINSDHYIERSGCYGHVTNGKSVRYTSLKNTKKLTDEQLKEKYLNKIKYNDRFEKIRIFDIYSDLNKSVLPDEDKYKILKIKEPYHYLETKTDEYILGTYDDGIRTERKIITFEIFCEIADSVTSKHKKDILEKELAEIEKTKKELEDKINSIK